MKLKKVENKIKSSFKESSRYVFWIGLRRGNSSYSSWKWLDGNYLSNEGAETYKDLETPDALYAGLYWNEIKKSVDWMGLTEKEAEGSPKYIEYNFKDKDQFFTFATYKYAYGYICETRGIHYTFSPLMILTHLN